jgi:hypothetical protein
MKIDQGLVKSWFQVLETPSIAGGFGFQEPFHSITREQKITCLSLRRNVPWCMVTDAAILGKRSQPTATKKTELFQKHVHLRFSADSVWSP